MYPPPQVAKGSQLTGNASGRPRIKSMPSREKSSSSRTTRHPQASPQDATGSQQQQRRSFRSPAGSRQAAAGQATDSQAEGYIDYNNDTQQAAEAHSIYTSDSTLKAVLDGRVLARGPLTPGQAFQTCTSVFTTPLDQHSTLQNQMPFGDICIPLRETNNLTSKNHHSPNMSDKAYKERIISMCSHR